MDLSDKAVKKAQRGEGGSLLERAAQRLEQTDSGPSHIMRAQEKQGAAMPPAPSDFDEAAAGRRSRRDEIDLLALREAGYIVPDAPPNIIAEEFRLIKRSLLLNAFGKGMTAIPNGNLILVTSSQPNEGKTFCAINLALSIASERDYTVLLVDADFAKPEVLSTLGLEGGKGLVDLITDPGLDMADCLIRTNIPNFAVLPAGRQHHLTTELLASDRMGKIVEEIAARYRDRVIIFDSPPVLASSAPAVLALHVGQVAYVVEADKTRGPQLEEGLALLNGCQHISLMLNKTQFSGSSRKFGAYYAYGQ
ncbi:MAG: XrtA-associated tyrosine autokinase [Sphingomonadales bacterium]